MKQFFSWLFPKPKPQLTKSGVRAAIKICVDGRFAQPVTDMEIDELCEKIWPLERDGVHRGAEILNEFAATRKR